MSRGFKASEFWFGLIGLTALLVDSHFSEGLALVQIGLITTAYITARGAKKYKHGETDVQPKPEK